MILCAPPLQPVTKTMATMTADWCGPACLSGMQFSIHCHQRRFTHSPPSFSRRDPLPTSEHYPLSPSESRLVASKRHCSKLFKKKKRERAILHTINRFLAKELVLLMQFVQKAESRREIQPSRNGHFLQICLSGVCTKSAVRARRPMTSDRQYGSYFRPRRRHVRTEMQGKSTAFQWSQWSSLSGRMLVRIYLKYTRIKQDPNRKRLKRTLIYFNTDTLYANFRGNLLYT